MHQQSRTGGNLAASRKDQTAFVSLLPRIRGHAVHRFRYLRPDEREEAVAVAVAHAFASFLTLLARGKDPAAFPSRIATYAVLAAASGRRIEGGSTTKDVLDPSSRRRRGHSVHGGLDGCDTLGNSQNEWWRDALVDSRVAVAEAAAFRIDFPTWLAGLPRVKRRAAVLLAHGNRTTAVARSLRLTLGRASQIRRELADSWSAFHGERPSSTDAESPCFERCEVALRRG